MMCVIQSFVWEMRVANYLSPPIRKSCRISSWSLAKETGDLWLVIKESRLGGPTAEIPSVESRRETSNKPTNPLSFHDHAH